jgi:hypothetical protein
MISKRRPVHPLCRQVFSGRGEGLPTRLRVIVCCLAATVAFATLLATPGLASGATLVTPSAIGLQAEDVPGFAPIAASVETFQDPSTDNYVAAFISCAGSDPLLSQLDSGPEATVSQAYGGGETSLSSQLGAPAYSAASVVFTDGTAKAAATAYQTLASTAFESCVAQQTDAIDDAQGPGVATSPTTVTALPTPLYGAASVAFDFASTSSLLGINDLNLSLEESILYSGKVVTMLITTGFQGTFPEATRLSILQTLAYRMETYSLSTPVPQPSQPPLACKSLIESSLGNEPASGEPVPSLELSQLGGFAIQISASINFGEADLCDSGVKVTPPSKWLKTGSSDPKLSLTTQKQNPMGPFTYSGADAKWALPTGAPANAHLQTEFNWGAAKLTTLAVSEEFSVANPTHPKLAINILEYTVPAFELSATLVQHGKALLQVGLTPSLEIGASLSKAAAEEATEEAEAAGETPETAIDDVAERASAGLIQGVDGEVTDSYDVAVASSELDSDVLVLDEALFEAISADPAVLAFSAAAAGEVGGTEVAAGEADGVDGAVGGAVDVGADDGLVDLLFLVLL